MLPGRRTDNGAIFIAQGPAPAGTPFVAGIAVSPAGVIYSSQALAPVWSPIDLFLSGEQGAWYDPSDLTTMFQDLAGTTPVTADGQTVGLILDKSKGLVLGSETVTNGTFDTDVSGWTGTNGASLSWSSGKCVATFSAAGDPTVSQIITQPAGYSLCTLTFTCNYTGASRYYFSVGVYSIQGDITSGQTVSLSFYSYNATSSAKYVEIRTALGVATGTFTIDDVSVKLVNGNHAVAPSDAARPLYKTSGGLHWLQYDGVDDEFDTAVIDKSAWAGGMGVAGHLPASGSGGIFDGLNGTVSANHEPFTDQNWYCGFGTATRTDAMATLTYGSKYVTSRLRDATTSKYRINGAQVGSSTTATNFGGSSIIRIGSGTVDAVGYFLAGNIYSLILLARNPTTQEITDTETWVNSKTGAY